jgi:hypothetical protein
MPRQITAGSSFWARLRGDGLSGNGSGDDAANPLAFEQFNRDIGQTADVAATSDTGDFSLIALFKRLLQKVTSGIATIDPILATATPVVINTGLNASQALWAAGEQPRVLYNGTSGAIYIRYGGAATIATPTYELAAGGSVVDSFAGAAQVIGAAGATGNIVITRLSA